MGGYTIPETIVLIVLGLLAAFIVAAMLVYIIKLFVSGIKNIRDKKQPDKLSGASGDKPALAKGSCGDVKLYDISDKDAAMIMAIVADELKTPLNELRFISIREAEE